MLPFYKPPPYATEADLAEYHALCDEGYPAWQARIMMGWEDPPDHEETENKE
jgi:hypothetical protein